MLISLVSLTMDNPYCRHVVYVDSVVLHPNIPVYFPLSLIIHSVRIFFFFSKKINSHGPTTVEINKQVALPDCFSSYWLFGVSTLTLERMIASSGAALAQWITHSLADQVSIYTHHSGSHTVARGSQPREEGTRITALGKWRNDTGTSAADQVAEYLCSDAGS